MSTPAPTPTILVVDDDHGLLILIEAALRAEKWNVATATSGAGALAWLRENSADLLLLDLKLSDIEGREFIGTLAGAGRSVPFIVITGQGDERVAVEMMKRGALDYLVKDVNFVEFVPAVVRRALARLADEKRLADAEEAAVESRSLTQAVLNSLAAHIAVLDQQGNIIAVNEPWNRFAHENGDPPFGRIGVGVNYLEICRQATRNHEQGVAETLAGIQAVIDRSRTHYSVEYPCHSHDAERWFVMTVTPLAKHGGGVVVSHADVTQRKQAEASLREERDFSSAVLDTAGALVTVLDEAGRVVRFNRACEQVTGYAAEEIVGKTVWHLLLPPEEVAAVRSVFDRLRAGRLPSQFENCWLTKTGQRRLISWSNSVLTKPDGTVRHIIGTGLDITERKRSEQRRHLQYETGHLLAAADSLAETIPKLLQTLAETLQWDVGEFWEAAGEPPRLRLIHVWHAPGRKLAAFVKHSVKLSFLEDAGLTGRVLSTHKPDWIPELARCPHFVRQGEAAQSGLRSALAFPIVLKDQTLGVMVFLTHRSTEPDEDLLQTLASLGSQVGQFMERKKAEEALREANEFGKQIIGGAQAGIVVCDRATRFAVWNPFMEQVTGYRANEVLGRPALEVFPFLREQHFERMFDRALAGEVFEGADILFDLPEKGKQGWTAARFAPWRDARQEIVGVIVAVRDITERRRLESELLEVTDREQQRIGHDLHDGLGQQLTGVEMKCFLLLEDLAADDLAARQAELQEQARQMSQVLRECITVTRSIARGLAPVVLKTEGLMGGLEQLARRTCVPGRIECRFVCRGPVPLDNVQTAKHLYRIAQEAVNNALKHARTRRIHIKLAHEQGMLRLQIKDDGHGLPKSMKSKSGMGLEVMRHRAQVIGASLEIASKRGKGVTVTCTLPLREP